MALPFDPIAEAAKNWNDREWDSVDSMRAATSIVRANQILNTRITDALSSLDLNLSRFEVLALLYLSRNKALPMGKIGERLQVHPASVTNTVDRLEGEGLVQRVAHPTDRRTTLARLTAAGERTTEKAEKILAEIEYGLAGMTRQGLNRVTKELETLRRHVGDFS